MKVFGLFIGSNGFQILTMIPGFGEKNSRVKSFTMDYGTNRDNLRYDLFKEKILSPNRTSLKISFTIPEKSHDQVPMPFKSVLLRKWFNASCLHLSIFSISNNLFLFLVLKLNYLLL